MTPASTRNSFAITFTLPILFLTIRLIICLNSTVRRNSAQIAPPHHDKTPKDAAREKGSPKHAQDITKSSALPGRYDRTFIEDAVQRILSKPHAHRLTPVQIFSVRKVSLHDMSQFCIILASRCVLQSLPARWIHCSHRQNQLLHESS